MPSAIELGQKPAAAGSSTLALLASAPSTTIVTVLGEGKLRSSRLNEALPDYSPRTVYRRLDELERSGVIERHRLGTSPPAVAYELTDPAGEDLLRIVRGPVAGWLQRHVGKSIWSQATTALALLAESWETKIFHELSCESRSLTELGEAIALTHHQAGRRAKRLAAAGILDRSVGEDRITRYALSESGRLGASVIAVAARWEQRHLSPHTLTLGLDDMSALLTSTLSLPRLPGHAGQVFGMTVEAGQGPSDSPRIASLWAEVGEDGAITCGTGPAPMPDGWAHGAIESWIETLVDGKRGTLQAGGDRALIDAHLSRLHTRLHTVR